MFEHHFHYFGRTFTFAIDNTSIEVTFEAIPPTTYTLTIKATGNGAATYEGTTVRGKSSQFTVTEGTNATVTFTPDTDNRIKSVKVNNADVTSSVTDGKYTISNIQANTSLEVVFEAIPTYSLNILEIYEDSICILVNTYKISNLTTAVIIKDKFMLFVNLLPEVVLNSIGFMRPPH